MARPDKSYLEKQTSRRNAPPKKKKLGESATDSRMAKISFKNYLRQIEEELLDELVEYNDVMNEDEDQTIKVAILDERDWDEYYNNDTAGKSMVDAFEFKESELTKVGADSWDDIEYSEDSTRTDLVDALRNGEIGKKLPDVEVKNEDFGLGTEGVEVPDGYELLVNWE